MRVYISVDMEGIAGVTHPHQVSFDAIHPDRTDYDRSRSLMAGEANAAVAAAFDAGADEVVVNDSHWQMRNLRAEERDPRARLLIGDKPFSMTQGIGRDEAFDAAAFIGYHAGAGNATGIIGHTYSNVVLEAPINGTPHNETGLNAMRLGAHGVPVVLVAGDDALAAEVEGLLPWAERVVVKRAHAALVADSLSPGRAGAAIGAGVRSALARLGAMEPYRVESPVRVEVDLRLPIMADYCAVIPGVERCAARSVTATAEDAETAFRYFIAIMRMAQVPAS